MESDQVQTYQIGKAEQSNNKENVVLRVLVGNPNQHKALAHHPPPTTAAVQEDIPASMYTLETRYQPIPPRVLPKPSEARLYYIDTKQAGQPTTSDPPITKEEQVTPLLAESKPRNVDVEQDPSPMIFLEPKVFSQPVLYSVVGAKNLPIHKDEPIPTDKEMPSPIFYAVTGQPRRLPKEMTASTLNIETPVTNRSPTLYSVVGSPLLRVRIQEPIKQELQESVPSLYSVVGSSRLQPQMQEPVKQVLPVSQPPSASFYSIVGGPTLTPHIPQTKTVNPPPPTQPVQVSSSQPVPILYTIVGETQVPTNIPKENRPPPPPPPVPIKNPPNDGTMYTMIGNPNIPQTVTLPRKTQPSQPLKQQSLQPLKQQPPQQQQTQASALYTVVGKPTKPSEENMDTLTKPVLRRKSPPPTMAPTRRISRSLERRPAPELVPGDDTSLPQIKRQRRAKSKEPTIPKSETTFIPISEHERSPRSRQTGVSPRRISPGQIRHNPYNVPQYDPLRLPDYLSPYAYHPSKPYREQTYNTNRLPALPNNRYEPRPRPPLSQPRHRDDRKHPQGSRTPRSLERYPVITKQRSRLWDYEDETQTDFDDDNDDLNESQSSHKKQGYRRIRRRAPWIPVW